MIPRINPLGDLRAEIDKEMLDSSFYETPDYKVLLESAEKSIVIGRRGTGKSALAYRLAKDFSAAGTAHVFNYAPEDYETTAIRHNLRALGTSYNLAKSASKLITKYALFLEILDLKSGHFKFADLADAPFATEALRHWRTGGPTLFERIGFILAACIKDGTPPEAIVGNLANVIQIRRLERFFNAYLETYDSHVVFLFDRLDEGYEHDTLGIAFLAGITEIVNLLNVSFGHRFRALVFLRDNIARAIERDDPDFTRNFEGQILRLHWGRYELFNMVCNRLRVAFSTSQENSQKVWDSLTAQNLKGAEGFDYCLRLTLYRPRDLLVLLNEAFNRAKKLTRDHIDDSDIEATAKDISNRRLGDLLKEYGKLIWGLDHFISVFRNGSGHLTVASASALLDTVLASEQLPGEVAQHCAILGNSSELLRCLYSVGFLGIKATNSPGYIYCHDGKTSDVEFLPDGELLLHPCYWMALNITDAALPTEKAESITDEYDDFKIDVASFGVEQRQQRLDQLIGALAKIEPGDTDAGRFENWCEQAIRIIYSGALTNIALHPNGSAVQRRDVVARNNGTRSAWKRIYEDYDVRQVIFEIKNYDADLGGAEFRQMSTYLKDSYGRLGFIINRSKNLNLVGGKELDWVREIWGTRKLVIKLNADYLLKMLTKLRNPQKHDEPDNSMNGLLDRYERLYLSIPSTKKKAATAPSSE